MKMTKEEILKNILVASDESLIARSERITNDENRDIFENQTIDEELGKRGYVWIKEKHTWISLREYYATLPEENLLQLSEQSTNNLLQQKNDFDIKKEVALNECLRNLGYRYENKTRKWVKSQ